MTLQGITLNFSLLLLLTGSLPISSRAQVYKWTDSDGKVQYGDRQPSGEKGELLSIKPAYGHNQTTPNWEDSEREFRKRRIEKQMQADKEKPAETAYQLCRKARYQLQMLDGKVVYRVNEQGERIYMEDTERNAIEKQAKQNVEKYCVR